MSYEHDPYGESAVSPSGLRLLAAEFRSHLPPDSAENISALAAYRFELLRQLAQAERPKDRKALIREAKLARCWQRELRTAMLFASAVRDVRVAP